MALIKCSECGNEISDKADTCPKCGINLKQRKKSKNGIIKNFGDIRLFIILLVLMVII